MEQHYKKEGAILASTNCRSLYEAALAVAKIGNYGCASSLMILSAEEGAKSITLGLDNNWAKEDSVENLFRSHKQKHQQAAYYASMLHGLMGLVLEPETGKPRHGECGIIETIAAWKASAEETKKLGFYVDFQNREWLSPAQATEERYAIAKYQAESLLAVSEGLFGTGHYIHS